MCFSQNELIHRTGPECGRRIGFVSGTLHYCNIGVGPLATPVDVTAPCHFGLGFTWIPGSNQQEVRGNRLCERCEDVARERAEAQAAMERAAAEAEMQRQQAMEEQAPDPGEGEREEDDQQQEEEEEEQEEEGDFDPPIVGLTYYPGHGYVTDSE